jgi:hypothetical protein
MQPSKEHLELTVIRIEESQDGMSLMISYFDLPLSDAKEPLTIHMRAERKEYRLWDRLYSESEVHCSPLSNMVYT